ncbi:MAG TPA: DUF5320 domain-containing protein [candidate division Zixibacteria bacterium]|nr:DUF5320 domain-containing protein [candidate division Zixibacteria bacterium]
MPGGDKTGPLGEGPMTGRGAGYCSGNDQPGYMSNWGAGRGGGFGRGGRRGGGGRGFRHQYYATGQPGWARGRGNVPFYREPVDVAPETNEPDLSKQLSALRNEIKDLRRQLDDLKSGEK